jgi:hypothetical protein
MLAHLYATALIVEGLFPDVGPSYLGVMCQPPLEWIHEILQSRRVAQPADSGCQMALQIIEYPIRVLGSYKSRQRQSSNPALAGPYGRSAHSPQQSPYMHGTGGASHHMGLASVATVSPGEQGGVAMYGGSPVTTPPSASASAPGAYFAASAAGGRRVGSPGGMSAPGLSERSASMSLVYSSSGDGSQLQQSGGQPQQVRSSHEPNTGRMDYFPAVLPSSPAIGGYQHNLPHQHHSQSQQQGGFYGSGGPMGTLGSSQPSFSHNRFVAPSQLYA